MALRSLEPNTCLEARFVGEPDNDVTDEPPVSHQFQGEICAGCFPCGSNFRIWILCADSDLSNRQLTRVGFPFCRFGTNTLQNYICQESNLGLKRTGITIEGQNQPGDKTYAKVGGHIFNNCNHRGDFRIWRNCRRGGRRRQDSLLYLYCDLRGSFLARTLFRDQALMA